MVCYESLPVTALSRMTLPDEIRTTDLNTVTIRAVDSRWRLEWKELWRHRELLYFLTWRDIKVRYKQTVLGVAWVMLQPIALALSLSLFFSHIIARPIGELPYPLFAFSGIALWQFFSQSLTESSNSLVANERLISKIYLPRLLMPLSSVLTSLFDFAINLVLLAAFLAYFKIPLQFSIMFLPACVLLAGISAAGAGFWLSALNVKYRDVRYTIGFIVQLWFLASPIAYSSVVVPYPWRLVYALNPMVGAIEGFRWALQGTSPPPVVALCISTSVAGLLFATGLYYFRRNEDTFADVI